MGAVGPGDHRTVGQVSFVGAGPGCSDLLTLRAAELLATADVVVHDRLVHASVLRLARPGAQLIPAPVDPSEAAGPPSKESPAGPSCKGRAIGELLVSLCHDHAMVIRLKGGDPSVFARLAEEIEPLDRAGVAWSVVPGVTAAVAAAAAARIPLTSRSSSSSLTILTGHEALGKRSEGSLQLLAAAGGTLVIYMGVERAGEWSTALIEAGRPFDAAVVIVSRCGCADERILRTTLGGVPQAIEGVASPAVAVVGEVVDTGPNRTDDDGRDRESPALSPTTGGSMRDSPLRGRRILLARPEGSSSDLTDRLRGLGAECVEVPVIRIEPPASWKPLDDAIASADRYDWITFSSVHGARAFAQRLSVMGRDGRHLGTVRLAAVGRTTAAELRAHGLVCDLVPAETASADALADLLLSTSAPTGVRSRFLLVRADRGRDVLRNRLQAAGHEVNEVCGYRSVDIALPSPEASRAVEGGSIDWVVLTSPSVARGVARLFPAPLLASARFVSISPLTTSAAEEVGIRPSVVAETPSARAVVDAILSAETGG